jgi:ornithine cyclodeaminase
MNEKIERSMIYLTDVHVDKLIDYRQALPVLKSAFVALADGRAAIQTRVRTESGGVKLSTLGAVIPDAGFVGAKVYTTIAGHFDFVIVLFSTEDGRPLAMVDAQSITRIRTAATTVLAAQALAREGAEVCAVLGTGVQGTAHAEAIGELLDVREIRIAGEGADQVAQRVRLGIQRKDVQVISMPPGDAIKDADIVVTATRATEPLFDGSLVKRGAFVAAIGSSLPNTRELDNTLLRRASTVVVDCIEQARAEAGDLILAGADVDWSRVQELSAVLAGDVSTNSESDDVAVYKAVGIGLQDIAVAGLVFSRYTGYRCQIAPIPEPGNFR